MIDVPDWDLLSTLQGGLGDTNALRAAVRDTGRGVLEDDCGDNVGGHEPENEVEGGVRRKAEEVGGGGEAELLPRAEYKFDD